MAMVSAALALGEGLAQLQAEVLGEKALLALQGALGQVWLVGQLLSYFLN
jgi:hypothetical protein